MLLAAALTMAGCATGAAAKPKLWHDGLLFMATGNTTGTYYTYGGGYADLVTKYVEGYQLRAEPTGASGENVNRVDSGDMELGLSHGDTAVDGVLGRGTFADRPRRVAALASMYPNTAQVVVRTASKIKTFADLRGKKVSTGSPNSGTDNVAARMLEAAGIDPDRDIVRQRISLPETTRGMKAGTTDVLIFVGGLPTPGVADLLASAPGVYTILPVDDLIEPLAIKHGAGVYGPRPIAQSVYSTPGDVASLAVPTMLLVTPDMPEELAYLLTKVLFEHQAELAKVHPEGANFDKTGARNTGQIPLHPGARRYYEEG